MPNPHDTPSASVHRSADAATKDDLKQTEKNIIDAVNSAHDSDAHALHDTYLRVAALAQRLRGLDATTHR